MHASTTFLKQRNLFKPFDEITYKVQTTNTSAFTFASIIRLNLCHYAGCILYTRKKINPIQI